MPVCIPTIHEALATWAWSWDASVPQPRRSANAHSANGKGANLFPREGVVKYYLPKSPIFLYCGAKMIAAGAAILRPLPINQSTDLQGRTARADLDGRFAAGYENSERIGKQAKSKAPIVVLDRPGFQTYGRTRPNSASAIHAGLPNLAGRSRPEDLPCCPISSLSCPPVALAW